MAPIHAGQSSLTLASKAETHPSCSPHLQVSPGTSTGSLTQLIIHPGLKDSALASWSSLKFAGEYSPTSLAYRVWERYRSCSPSSEHQAYKLQPSVLLQLSLTGASSSWFQGHTTFSYLWLKVEDTHWLKWLTAEARVSYTLQCLYAFLLHIGSLSLVPY